MNSRRKHRSDYRKGIYILPNLFTTLSLFFGFYSILNSVAHHFSIAAWAILISALCDALDGTVARMTGTTSKFGMEYDSLCDLVAFGVAPALMVYLWALGPDNLAAFKPYDQKLGAVAAFIFLACGALRLARFNVFSGTRDPGFFQGLPIPGGAALLSAAVLWHNRQLPALSPDGPSMLALTLCLAFLMVSNIDYASHKNKAIFRSHRPFETLVLAVLLLGLVAMKIKSTLLPLGFLYLLSGPVVTVVRRARRGKKRGLTETPAPEQAPPTQPPRPGAI